MAVRDPFARPEAFTTTTPTGVKTAPLVPGLPPASVGGSKLLTWGIPLALLGVGVFVYLRRRKARGE